MQKLLLVNIIQKIAPQAKSGKHFQIWFFPRFGGKNGGVLSMRMQVILDSSFARPGSVPIWGGKKGEFRDWTRGFREQHQLAIRTGSELVQSMNSPFFPPHIGAEPWRAKEESRITCMRMLTTNQSKIIRSQPRRSRQCVAQCLFFQLAL